MKLGMPWGSGASLFPAPWTFQMGRDTQLTCECEKKSAEPSQGLLEVGLKTTVGPVWPVNQ